MTATETKNEILCGGEEALSRFLDNDLPSREAAQVALHLQNCSSCQAVYQQMQRAQTALRGLPSPGAPYGGPHAARVRVFERMERNLRVTEAAQAASRKTARFPLWANPAAGVAAAAAVCVIAVGVFSWNAQTVPSGDAAAVPASEQVAVTTIVPTPTATPRVPLPSQNEMAFLYHLHDAHSASLSVSDPTDRRDCAAEARAALLRDSERLADTGAF